MFEWIPLKRVRSASSWTYLPLDREIIITSHGSWAGSARKALSGRTIRRALLGLLLILLVVGLFHLRTLRGLRFHETCSPEELSDEVDWSQYAYCQYVMNSAYLCNSIMIFEALDRVGTKASNVMMFPESWDVTANDKRGRLIRQAQAEYNIQLSPVRVQRLDGEPTWADSFTKLLAFNQTQFKRVLSLDSDATILKSMDELFHMPSSPVAMPRAYWLNDTTLSSQLVLIEPSEFEFQRILKAFESRSSDDFDMEIVNDLYGSDCMIICHRKYDLLTGEFRAKEHRAYLGSMEEKWDPDKVLEEAKFVHFSDWPMPKPWLLKGKTPDEEFQPECRSADAGEDCRDRDIWLELYADFAQRMKLCEVQ